VILASRKKIGEAERPIQEGWARRDRIIALDVLPADLVELGCPGFAHVVAPGRAEPREGEQRQLVVFLHRIAPVYLDQRRTAVGRDQPAQSVDHRLGKRIRPVHLAGRVEEVEHQPDIGVRKPRHTATIRLRGQTQRRGARPAAPLSDEW
jgi:hypothetical protein